MYSLAQLEKQQVGLRLPRYLVEQLDALAENHSLNRTDLIFEAVRSYIEKQKEAIFYAEFQAAAQDLKALQNGKNIETSNLQDLLNELEHSDSAEL